MELNNPTKEEVAEWIEKVNEETSKLGNKD